MATAAASLAAAGRRLVFQKVPRREATSAGRDAAVKRVECVLKGDRRGALQFRDEQILVDSEQGYEQARLDRKVKKSVRFQTDIEVWGAHLEGNRGAVRSKHEILGRAVASRT